MRSFWFSMCVVAMAGVAQADINITVTPGLSDSVVVTGTGSGTITHDAVSDQSNAGSFQFWEYEFFEFASGGNPDADFFQAAVPRSIPFTFTGAGSVLTNVTTGVSVPIRDFSITDVSSFDANNNTYSGVPGDFLDKPLVRFRLEGPGGGVEALPLNAGDEYEFVLSGVSEIPSGSFETGFSGLVPGVYTTTRSETNGYDHDRRTEVFGTFTMTIVPEPSSVAMAVLGLGAVIVPVARRRFRRA